MIRFINIIAGLSVSLTAMADEQRVVRDIKQEVVLQEVVVEPTNGSFNPEARAYIVRGQVMVAPNKCAAQGLRGKLEVEKAADGTLQVVPYVVGRQRSDLVCIQIFQPVYADVTVTVRGDRNLVETVFIRNVDELGTLRPLSDFTEFDESAENSCSQPIFCSREYLPVVCTALGQEIKGNNRCEALANVNRFACQNGYTFQQEAVSCRSVTAPAQ